MCERGIVQGLWPRYQIGMRDAPQRTLITLTAHLWHIYKCMQVRSRQGHPRWSCTPHLYYPLLWYIYMPPGVRASMTDMHLQAGVEQNVGKILSINMVRIINGVEGAGLNAVLQNMPPCYGRHCKIRIMWAIYYTKYSWGNTVNFC